MTKEKKSETKEEKKENKKVEKSAVKKLTKEEYEGKIIELAKQGFTSEKIGEALRKESIHPNDYKIKISRILKQHNLYVNPDTKNIETKLGKLKSHTQKYKQDKKAMRESVRIAAQLRKFKEVYSI